MRDKGFLKKTATAFMAEPTLTFNMIRDGWISAREAWKSGDKVKAEQIKWRTIGVALLQAASVGGMAAIVDALRKKKPDKDDDDEGFLHLWWVNALENFKDELKLWNKVYFVKDIASTFEGWENSNLALQGIQKFALGYRQLTGDPYARSSAEWYENMADGIGYMWGIPIKTIRTGLKNAMNGMGLASPFLESVGDRLSSVAKDSTSDDKEVSGFIGTLLSDDGRGLFGKLLTTKSDNVVSDTTDIDAKVKEYRESLSDTYTDEQKDELVKQYEKRIKKETANEEVEKRDRDTMLFDAEKAAAGYEGSERDKRIWQSVSKGYKSFIEEGNYERIMMMRRVVEELGGDLDYFDKQVNEASKVALKKSIKPQSEMTEEEFNAQRSILGHLRQSEVPEEEIRNYIYKSETRTNLQVAMRINDEDAIFEELTALVGAGFTEEDFEKAYKNRNRVNLKNYKEKGGKYADRLKSMGTFIWPATGPITSHFGFRDAPTAGASSNHPAIDIGIPIGTPVAAADGGVVIYAGQNSGYGKSVGIKHDNGMVTYYNHLDSWNVKVGDTVAQGQQIACSGNTGISTGPHLDFKILDADGNPVNPEKYLN
jgi:murein DD-endopeptidase MepM/ murein hydrolase activator NlpD